ncbi:heparan-alpha-glucosaminide N-acetyltransferase domain-containing protein [Colwellia sp. UCD-KL20]|uniref:DUF1624 domain-containing protein n=1 Tax=Colwellia sp. UCD-KL20 TaxID=1917165 RepID=UPI000970933E|nr:heparan-alpha-glucosaminide N-acetyltransferase domain-containing protein [Colwellia sp. UCD-KL20]
MNNLQHLKNRIPSIDILRGLVILLMLVDHVRERVFLHMQVADPMVIEETSSALFFTRFMAHFCAPVFILLTGLSAWLYANPVNKPQRNVRSFLIKRGLFIIFLELTLVNFSWFGSYNALYLQVMWAIGLSMIALAALTYLPHRVIGLIGIAIIFGHNALDFVTFTPDEFGYSLWTILHDRGYLFTSETFKIKVSYPTLPWIGVICLGYFIAPIFSSKFETNKRMRILFSLGAFSLLTLLIIRLINVYIEPVMWANFDNLLLTVQSFVNFTKYPPSLGFLLITLGVAFIVLALLEKNDSDNLKFLRCYGSAPLFFYLLHLYVLLILYWVLVSIFGTNKGIYYGVDSVWQVWAISIALSLVLYLPTKKFSNFKKSTHQAWVKYM